MGLPGQDNHMLGHTYGSGYSKLTAMGILLLMGMGISNLWVRVFQTYRYGYPIIYGYGYSIIYGYGYSITYMLQTYGYGYSITYMYRYSKLTGMGIPD